MGGCHEPAVSEVGQHAPEPSRTVGDRQGCMKYSTPQFLHWTRSCNGICLAGVSWAGDNRTEGLNAILGK